MIKFNGDCLDPKCRGKYVVCSQLKPSRSGWIVACDTCRAQKPSSQMSASVDMGTAINQLYDDQKKLMEFTSKISKHQPLIVSRRMADIINKWSISEAPKRGIQW